MPDIQQKRVLVLGAYGLIGQAIAQSLMAQDHAVVCFGRNSGTAYRTMPSAEWVFGDLRQLQSAQSWQPVLIDMDFVVNCAGALQDNGNDDLEAVHHSSISCLASECARLDIGLIQISASGAHADAPTHFMRTKAEGDASIRASGATYFILRPGMVIAQNAYGGSLLLRMLASIPFIQPIALPEARVQTVGIDEISRAVSDAISDRLPKDSQFDLVESEPHSLREVVAAHRRWLGLPPAKIEFVAPHWMMQVTQFKADLLGKLGWRSPLRSTAITELETGVGGNPEPFEKATARAIRSLDETLAHIPTSSEHRLHAVSALLMPIAVASLAIFWFLSGAIGIVSLEKATKTLTDVGWSQPMATSAVLGWSLVDIALAGLIAHRRTAKMACNLMMLVSVIYLVSASLFTPGLWLHPLGPLVKVIPAFMLVLITRVWLSER